jgi:hypothetical protein
MTAGCGDSRSESSDCRIDLRFDRTEEAGFEHLVIYKGDFSPCKELVTNNTGKLFVRLDVLSPASPGKVSELALKTDLLETFDNLPLSGGSTSKDLSYTENPHLLPWENTNENIELIVSLPSGSPTTLYPTKATLSFRLK